MRYLFGTTVLVVVSERAHDVIWGVGLILISLVVLRMTRRAR